MPFLQVAYPLSKSQSSESKANFEIFTANDASIYLIFNVVIEKEIKGVNLDCYLVKNW